MICLSETIESTTSRICLKTTKPNKIMPSSANKLKNKSKSYNNKLNPAKSNFKMSSMILRRSLIKSVLKPTKKTSENLSKKFLPLTGKIKMLFKNLISYQPIHWWETTKTSLAIWTTLRTTLQSTTKRSTFWAINLVQKLLHLSLSPLETMMWSLISMENSDTSLKNKRFESEWSHQDKSIIRRRNRKTWSRQCLVLCKRKRIHWKNPVPMNHQHFSEPDPSATVSLKWKK